MLKTVEEKFISFQNRKKKKIISILCQKGVFVGKRDVVRKI
jgi:hypothetical protein